ncbi:pyruvate dehydrogenase (acetyl-transferring) E1 component subunit alpha [Ferruginivarius sediminum]|uniref:Pyruvate dehydrogenase E1 component subunit alpha n=1 Tax=Ferruginivarius sediminum TaxID=2661937 RepID=A0A369T781_9PROT|nr:pyruvate dehydrogenase (acetyl-transferring) E1 component subunit alpha [Ferruginivarius sediminum]RDD61183.1 pyruvate dehydrogenase (acetyl-transferring) E1 component subunit alpha [Ferruginivarius sediminum]
MSTVARFEFRYTRVLDPSGALVGELPDFAGDREALVDLYRGMVRTRRFDAKAVSLQRTGRLGTYASSLGQEATSVGIGAAMAADDVLVPSYREAGTQLWRGVTPLEILLYWGGDERGMDYQVPREDFPISVPVGSQALHATGCAYAFKLRRQKRATVAVLGDGGTSRGDFYEAINMAGVWHVPAVFVVSNNRYAISVPLRRQTAAQSLAQKAVAAGIPGEQVDGNDVLAVRHAVARAVARARAGEGPSLIEALTYRLGDHTTADDASRYREEAEVSAKWKEDPIVRLRSYLANAGLWTKADEEKLLEEVEAELTEAVDAYLATPPQPPEAMFDYLYAELPTALVEQRRLAAGGEDDEDGGDG